jgi:sn-glycerol 3-phosphate transport system permease protein
MSGPGTAADLMESRGFWRVFETGAAWLLGLLWFLPLIYAVWTAFHPPEFQARFEAFAPGTPPLSAATSPTRSRSAR